MYHHLFLLYTIISLYHISSIHSYTIANYQDSSCTQITPGQSVKQQTNGACISNPQSSSQSFRVICATNTSDSTYTFQGYLSSDCTGFPLVNDQNEHSITTCLDVYNHYFAIDCSNVGTALPGTPTTTPSVTIPTTASTDTTTAAPSSPATTIPTLPASGNTSATASQVTSTSIPNITGADLGSAGSLSVDYSMCIMAISILFTLIL